MTPITPGRKTTEFLLTVVTVVISLLVTTGVLKPADAPELRDATARAVESAAALIAAGAVVWRYIASRTDVKTTT